MAWNGSNFDRRKLSFHRNVMDDGQVVQNCEMGLWGHGENMREAVVDLKLQMDLISLHLEQMLAECPKANPGEPLLEEGKQCNVMSLLC